MNTKVTSINAGTKRRGAALKATLNECLKLAGDREGLEIQQMADPLDQVQSSTDREMTLQRLDQQGYMIREIQSALARIEGGSYGSCERCEQPIPPRRLEALPWASLCVNCQSEAEIEDATVLHSAA